MKRRPTARDRTIADKLCSLPEGLHRVVVDADDGRPVIKKEGGMILYDLPGHRRLTLIPDVDATEP